MPVFFAVLAIFFVFPKIVIAQVVINEFSAKSDPEWVELYNCSDSAVNLDGWEIADGNSYSTDDLTITGTIEPHGFLVYEHPKGWLNDSSSAEVIDTIYLYDNSTPSGQLIDSVAYTSAKEGFTTSRLPDGTGDFFYLTQPTLGFYNQAPPTATETPSPTPTDTPTSTPTLTQALSPTPHSPKTITLNPTPSFSVTDTLSPTTTSISSLYSSPSSSVLASATSSAFKDFFFQESSPSSSPSAQSSPANQSKANLVLIGLGLFIISSSTYLFRQQTKP